jgi:hypothetical protein
MLRELMIMAGMLSDCEERIAAMRKEFSELYKRWNDVLDRNETDK